MSQPEEKKKSFNPNGAETHQWQLWLNYDVVVDNNNAQTLTTVKVLSLLQINSPNWQDDIHSINIDSQTQTIELNFYSINLFSRVLTHLLSFTQQRKPITDDIWTLELDPRYTTNNREIDVFEIESISLLQESSLKKHYLRNIHHKIYCIVSDLLFPDKILLSFLLHPNWLPAEPFGLNSQPPREKISSECLIVIDKNKDVNSIIDIKESNFIQDKSFIAGLKLSEFIDEAYILEKENEKGIDWTCNGCSFVNETCYSRCIACDKNRMRRSNVMNNINYNAHDNDNKNNSHGNNGKSRKRGRNRRRNKNRGNNKNDNNDSIRNDDNGKNRNEKFTKQGEKIGDSLPVPTRYVRCCNFMQPFWRHEGGFGSSIIDEMQFCMDLPFVTFYFEDEANIDNKHNDHDQEMDEKFNDKYNREKFSESLELSYGYAKFSLFYWLGMSNMIVFDCGENKRVKFVFSFLYQYF